MDGGTPGSPRPGTRRDAAATLAVAAAAERALETSRAVAVESI
jgi:hypothetical protein